MNDARNSMGSSGQLNVGRNGIHGIGTHPSVFRLEQIYPFRAYPHGRTPDACALLYHEARQLIVAWPPCAADTRLRPGCIVSPRFIAGSVIGAGPVRVAALEPLEGPRPDVNLFDLVPASWVGDRALVQAGRSILDTLPDSFRQVFNAVFWTGDRFHRYCTAPRTHSDATSTRHGLLRHTLMVASLVRDHFNAQGLPPSPVGTLAALLLDAGVADQDRNLSGPGQTEPASRHAEPGEHGRLASIRWLSSALGDGELDLSPADLVGLYRCLAEPRLIDCLKAMQRSPVKPHAIHESRVDRWRRNRRSTRSPEVQPAALWSDIPDDYLDGAYYF